MAVKEVMVGVICRLSIFLPNFILIVTTSFISVLAAMRTNVRLSLNGFQRRSVTLMAIKISIGKGLWFVHPKADSPLSNMNIRVLLKLMTFQMND